MGASIEQIKAGAIRQSDLSAFDRCALTGSFERELRGKNWATHPQARG